MLVVPGKNGSEASPCLKSNKEISIKRVISINRPKVNIILSLIITILCFALSSCGREAKYGNISISLDLNTVIKSDDAGFKAIIGTSKLDSAMLNIEVDGTIPEFAIVSGEIRLNDLSFQLGAEGYLEQNKIRGNQEYTKGLFTGHLYKDGKEIEEITFDLLYKEGDRGSAVSSVTIGDILPHSEAEPISLLFGSSDNVEYVTYNEYAFEKEELHLYPHHTVQTAAVLTNAEGAQLVYLAGYHPYTLGNSGNYGIYIRSWTNMPNIEKHMEAEHNTSIVGNAKVYKAELDITVSEYLNVSDPYPDEKASKYSVKSFSVGESGLNRTKISWDLTDKKYNDTEAKSENPWNDNEDTGIAASAVLKLPFSSDTNVSLPLGFTVKLYVQAQSDSGKIYSIFALSADSVAAISPNNRVSTAAIEVG